LDYWSDGVLVEKLDIFLQHSNTPSLQCSTIVRFMVSAQPWDYYILGYSSEKNLLAGQDDLRRKPQLLIVFSGFDFKAVVFQFVG